MLEPTLSPRPVAFPHLPAHLPNGNSFLHALPPNFLHPRPADPSSCFAHFQDDLDTSLVPHPANCRAASASSCLLGLEALPATHVASGYPLGPTHSLMHVVRAELVSGP